MALPLVLVAKEAVLAAGGFLVGQLLSMDLLKKNKNLFVSSWYDYYLNFLSGDVSSIKPNEINSSIENSFNYEAINTRIDNLEHSYKGINESLISLSNIIGDLKKEIADSNIAINDRITSLPNANELVKDTLNNYSANKSLLGVLSLNGTLINSLVSNLNSINLTLQSLSSQMSSVKNVRIENTSALTPQIVNNVAPNLEASLSVKDSITIKNLDEVLSVSRDSLEIEKARALREVESHEILKEKTAFLTTPRVIADIDGNELAKVAPREINLIHNATLARTYADENSLSLEDVDFGNFDLEFADIFTTLKPGLVSDIESIKDI